MLSRAVMESTLSNPKSLGIRLRKRGCVLTSYSSSEPFNEEMEIEYDKFVNWLDHFGLPMYHIHCSGHIMPTEVRQVVERIAPKTFFPIHTEHPELYARFVSGVTRAQLPEKNKTAQVA